MRKALVIGHSGQDGTYLSQLLRGHGYSVTGIGQPFVAANARGHSFDVTDPAEMRRLLAETQPEEIYYLAAFHHSSEDAPLGEHELISKSFAVNTLGLNNVLGAALSECAACRVFYAGSSRMFGEPTISPQNEDTPLRPTCAYGISKVAGMGICSHYRRTRKLFVATGLLYNHESPLRPAKFISRKIVRAAVNIANGSTEKLVVGSLDSKVDWGYAPDYARAMWRVLQLEEPTDFVIGTGTLHSVRDFAQAAFSEVGLDWQKHVQEDPTFLTRTPPKGTLLADSGKLRALTGWRPEVDFGQMVKLMVEAENGSRG